MRNRIRTFITWRSLGTLSLALSPALFTGHATAQALCTNNCPPPVFTSAPSLNLPGPGIYRSQFLGSFSSLPNQPAGSNVLKSVIFGAPGAFTIASTYLSATGPAGGTRADSTAVYAYGDISVVTAIAPPSLLLLNLSQSGVQLITGFDRLNIASATVTTGCAANVTPNVQISVAPPLQLFGTQLWTNVVTVQNTSGSPINGPLQLIVFGPSDNARLFGPTGTATCAGIAGSAFQTIAQSSLAPNSSIKVVLTFTNTGIPSTNITFTPLLFAGGSLL